MTLNEIMSEYPDAEFLKADGFDEAVIGVKDGRLIYSVHRVLSILMKDMSYEDAREHFDFNIGGAYVGQKTPIWCEGEE